MGEANFPIEPTRVNHVCDECARWPGELFAVDAGYFLAGFVTDKLGVVILASPMVRYFIGRHFSWCMEYSRNHGWRCQRVEKGKQNG